MKRLLKEESPSERMKPRLQMIRTFGNTCKAQIAISKPKERVARIMKGWRTV